MQHLKKALTTVYEGSFLLQEALRSLYFINKAASGKRPFAVVKPILGSHAYTSRNRIDWLPIQFDIEARTEESLLHVVDLIYLAFDNAVLKYTGSTYKHISIRRVDFDGPDEDSGTWTFSIFYIVQRAKLLVPES